MEEKILFQPNLVSCPKCNHTFENNKINGIALIEAVHNIDARKRMYCKLSLDSLERIDKTDGQIKFPLVKKIVLDNFNDFVRDIQTILGYGVEVE